jgi:hypothetical protein
VARVDEHSVDASEAARDLIAQRIDIGEARGIGAQHVCTRTERLLRLLQVFLVSPREQNFRSALEQRFCDGASHARRPTRNHCFLAGVARHPRLPSWMNL